MVTADIANELREAHRVTEIGIDAYAGNELAFESIENPLRRLLKNQIRRR